MFSSWTLTYRQKGSILNIRSQLFHFQGLQIKTITFTNVGVRFLKSRIAKIFTTKIGSRKKYIKNQCFKVKMSIHLFVFCASPPTRVYTYLIFLKTNVCIKQKSYLVDKNIFHARTNFFFKIELLETKICDQICEISKIA